jgi:cation:H+ antiporter
LFFLDILIGVYHITSKYNIIVLPDVIVSIASIYTAGDIFLDVSYNIGKSFSLSEKYVGLFIVGFAAIIDEIAMSVMAAVENLGSISLGTIQGSNVITLLAFFILIPLYYRTGISRYSIDSYVILATSIILLVLSFYFVKVPFYLGFITFFIFLFYIAKKTKSGVYGDVVQVEEVYPAYYGLLALISIALASYNMINSALIISYVTGINTFISSFFLLGFFGSLPEIMMMSIAMRDKRKDVSIGLITGSTVYKETILLSIIAFIGTLTFYNSIFSLIIMVIFSGVLIVYTQIFR